MTRGFITMALVSLLAAGCSGGRPPPGGSFPDGGFDPDAGSTADAGLDQDGGLDASMPDATMPTMPCSAAATVSWSGLAPSLALDEMTDQERVALCDFGRTLGAGSCGGISISVQAGCEAALAQVGAVECGVTACQLEACFIEDTKVRESTECRPVECAGFDECYSRVE